MKFLLTFILMTCFYQHSLRADEGSNPENKPESNISSSTKKVLRKVGRKVRDESCELTEDKAKCESEKVEHLKANVADKLDTKKRKMDKAIKEYGDELNKKDQ